MAPDGADLYAGRALVGFARDRTTGALAPLKGAGGCVGRRLRDCAPAHVTGDDTLVISQDGRALYSADALHGRIAAFSRSPETGALRVSPRRDVCLGETGLSRCRPARGLRGVNLIRVSGDGRSLYARSLLAGEPTSGAILVSAVREDRP
jgi:hypothetical protein